MNGEVSSSTNPSGIQGICPVGWHLPSYAEWNELIYYLGGYSVAGGKLKEISTTYWISPNTGATNETGFTALQGGSRDNNGTFNSIGKFGNLWSCTQRADSHFWNIYPYWNSSNITAGSVDKFNGFCVRCLRD